MCEKSLPSALWSFYILPSDSREEPQAPALDAEQNRSTIQPQRGCVFQPRVAHSHRGLPWVPGEISTFQPQRGCGLVPQVLFIELNLVSMQQR
jgi:hypothetical protein